MRALFVLTLLLLTASPAAAAPDWRQAREYDVLLSSFDIEPRTMSFRAGEPLRLRLINNSVEPHSFSAEGFFAAGEVRERERSLVRGGSVTVAPGETREVLIVPKAGRYSARCGNLFHRIMGMSARIVVE
jgi:uncharacterized cupredoxin-like copper-binding protein